MQMNHSSLSGITKQVCGRKKKAAQAISLRSLMVLWDLLGEILFDQIPKVSPALVGSTLQMLMVCLKKLIEF